MRGLTAKLTAWHPQIIEMQGVDIVHEGNIRHVVVDAYSAACQIVSGTALGRSHRRRSAGCFGLGLSTLVRLYGLP